MTNIQFSKEDVGKRIDLLVLKELKKSHENLSVTRSQLIAYIPKFVQVNGKNVKKGYTVRENDKVEVDIEGIVGAITQKLQSLDEKIEPLNKALNIIEESKDWIVINKPHGVAVHPGVGNENNTIANMVKYYLLQKNEFDPSVARAGVVHRLDKGVGGLMIIAKNRITQQYLQKQFEERRVSKIYLAEIKKLSTEVPESSNDLHEEIEKLIKNKFEIDERWVNVSGYIARQASNRMMMQINDYYKGKSCESHVLSLAENKLLIKLETGRMHQARVTARYLGWVILGDKLYGDATGTGIIKLEQVVLSLTTPDGIERIWRLV